MPGPDAARLLQSMLRIRRVEEAKMCIRDRSLAALECVDFVAINRAVSAVDALHKIQPNVYAKGSEYRSHGDDVTGNIIREQNAVEEHGGEIFYTCLLYTSRCV